jgi:hypothetical protein
MFPFICCRQFNDLKFLIFFYIITFITWNFVYIYIKSTLPKLSLSFLTFRSVDFSICRRFDALMLRHVDVSMFSKMISNVKGFSTYLCTPQNYKPIHHLLVMLDEKIQSEGFLPSFLVFKLFQNNW